MTTTATTTATDMEHEDVCGLDDEPQENEMVRFLFRNNVTLTVEKKKALISEIVTNALDGEFQNDDNTIDLTAQDPNAQYAVTFEGVQKIIEYMEACDGKEPDSATCPLESTEFSQIFAKHPNWLKSFLASIWNTGNDYSLLFKVLNAANYLNIPSLVKNCGAVVALILKGQKVEELESLLRGERKKPITVA